MLEYLPNARATRLFGQPQKGFEKTFADYADTLAAVIRESF
ncbi:MAG: hypothetical protein ACK49N_11110 [Verrucomicrobiota bacterium]